MLSKEDILKINDNDIVAAEKNMEFIENRIEVLLHKKAEIQNLLDLKLKTIKQRQSENVTEKAQTDTPVTRETRRYISGTVVCKGRTQQSLYDHISSQYEIGEEFATSELASWKNAYLARTGTKVVQPSLVLKQICSTLVEKVATRRGPGGNIYKRIR